MSVLDRFSEISSKIYMDGKFYKSQSTESIDVIDPATENKIGEIPETSQSEIDEVVSIANKAQKAWNQKSPCLLYTSPSPRDGLLSRMPSSA